MVKETGERGAQMVYQHGVGVTSSAIDRQPRDVEDDTHSKELSHEDSHEQDKNTHIQTEKKDDAHGSHNGQQMFQMSSTEINFTQDGWTWDVGKDGVKEFRKQFMMIFGDWSNVQVAVDHDNTEQEVLTLQTNDVPMMFTSSGPLISNLQYDLRLKRAAFSGAVRLVHHVQDSENYNFLEIRETNIVLGRVVNGILDIEDRGEIAADGWLDVRVVSDGSHFRGYVNKKMVVHGHGAEPDAGSVGFYIRGTGVVMFDKFDVQVLR